MLKIMMADIKKKGWLSLSLTTSAAVFSVGSCMIVIMILLGGINPLCDKKTNTKEQGEHIILHFSHFMRTAIRLASSARWSTY